MAKGSNKNGGAKLPLAPVFSSRVRDVVVAAHTAVIAALIAGLIMNIGVLSSPAIPHPGTKPIARASQNPLIATAHAAGPPSLQVPILLYHYTPGDFEQQLQTLEQRGYETINLDQLALAFTQAAPLPPKPVIITFDDGFSDQLRAIGMLEAHHMKATFYIINGGPESGGCLGASRTNLACGDAYLNWDEIKALDRNPLFTIASHSHDHANLASVPPEVQRAQIVNGKVELEHQLGHPVKHFCYPYGAYNETTLALVREAGFITATTTQAGIEQTAGGMLALSRVRDTYSLP